MSVWRRYLVKDVTGRLVDLPSSLLDRADDGTAPLPHFAGRCVEMVAAVIVGDRKTHARVTELAFTKLYFDQMGYVDAAKRERMIRLMLESCADSRCRPPRQDCAQLSRRAVAARDQLIREFGWEPKPAERDAALSRLDPARLRGAPSEPARTLH
ncbi:hypothetical protein TSH7_07960 [Azospirillum sp. TSH7]|uniref:hypothetical protein n=1 Tax=unclassified Azospirillum TaxID=2630922 RepID=UPI000D612EB4|nr:MULTISPECIES: hypothetical protein [unclassified Azospirillum]PWC59627.1 hypothetical protein TSH20_27225 [Azospirillum sp. TSH20]PWC65687.1 hypothetical protein TSH7_07960 [Azospirillum sp. TSH7]QCG95234.1 hypothetical protein E6C67_15190 [Azospirillum sp. TSA2s]